MENDDFNAVLSPQHANYYTTSQLGRADVPSLGALTPKAFYKNMHYFMIPFKMQVMEHFYQLKTSNRPTVCFPFPLLHLRHLISGCPVRYFLWRHSLPFLVHSIDFPGKVWLLVTLMRWGERNKKIPQ